MPQSIKILVVDDSAVMRQFLKATLDAQKDMQVVAVARDAFAARDKFLKYRPDVITLDIEMPGMDGLTFLEKLMKSHPTPVVMISARTKAGAESTLRALALGAIDFVAKPLHNLQQNLAGLEQEIIRKVRSAAGVGKDKIAEPVIKAVPPPLSVPRKVLVEEVVGLAPAKAASSGPQVWLLGASTGGTVAIEAILSNLPADCPPIAIVQHMPPHFTTAFAERLNQRYTPEVLEGEQGMKLRPGRIIIAPGDIHMLLEQNPAGYYIHLKKGPPVNRHRPSVDVLFRSGLNTAGKNAKAVLLTGMGDDGARGMKDLHNAGAYTIAQDEASSTVYGMPRVAMEMGGVDDVLPLDGIASVIVSLWRGNGIKGQLR